MRNWAGNREYGARGLLAPRSVDELQVLVAQADRLRAVGTRHSFNDIGDTHGDLLTLESLPRVFDVDAVAGTLTIDAGARLGDASEQLDAAGFALANLPSLPHVTIAGACLTGTHGSGDRNGVLATMLAGMDLVTADGVLHRISGDEGDDVPLAAAAASLGCLGIATQLVLRVEPRYRMRQDVYERLALDRLVSAFDEVMALGDSVSCFLDWRHPTVDQVWVKRRIGTGTDDLHGLPATLHGAQPATTSLHPIRGLDAAACTPQLGLHGPWHERLPHFRMGHRPSSGDELQSEYFVGREDAPAVIEALWSIHDRFDGLVKVSEIRTIARDGLWLSPASGRETAAIHFTWRPDSAGVATALPAIERVLAPFAPRAHWAKLSTLSGPALLATYTDAAAFARIRERFDPGGALRNAWTERVFGPG